MGVPGDSTEQLRGQMPNSLSQANTFLSFDLIFTGETWSWVLLSVLFSVLPSCPGGPLVGAHRTRRLGLRLSATFAGAGFDLRHVVSRERRSPRGFDRCACLGSATSEPAPASGRVCPSTEPGSEELRRLHESRSSDVWAERDLALARLQHSWLSAGFGMSGREACG